MRLQSDLGDVAFEGCELVRKRGLDVDLTLCIAAPSLSREPPSCCVDGVRLEYQL